MARLRNIWLRVALILSLLLPLYFLAAALCAKFHILDWRIAFGVLVVAVGGIVLLTVFVLALIGVILALAVKPRTGWRLAILALVIPAIGLCYAAIIIAGARTVPPIHDISTNIQDPPLYGPSVVAARATTPGGNAVESLTVPIASLASYHSMRDPALKSQTVGALGRKANPDLVSLSLSMSVPQAVSTAAEVARAQGWQVTRVAPSEGRIEAIVESFWFGFKDDVVVRVRPGPSERTSILDVRSTSRVGVSDLGVNAKRVRNFLIALKAAR